MLKSALATSVLLAAAVISPASAHPLVIASLAEDTVLPSPVNSDAALANAYRAQHARYDDAARQMGFSATEKARISAAFTSGHAQAVTIPRHLDAMSEYRHGRVQILHDVVIPANEQGYAVSVNEPNGVLTAYVPKVCGNLSYVRTSRPRVAAAHTVNAPRPLVAAARTTAPPEYAPGAPSYAVPEGAPVYQQQVIVTEPEPVYVEPSYGVRVYVGPRYVPAPRYVVRSHYVVREHGVYGYAPHVGYGYGYSAHVGYGYGPHARYGYAPHGGYGYVQHDERGYASERGRGDYRR